MIEYAGITEIGPVREDNQDSLYLPDGACPPEVGPIFALADGMGGYAQGGLASSLALKVVLETYLQNLNGKPGSALKHGVEAANTAVCAEADRLGVARMGTTLIVAVVHGSTLFIAHVGDSRAYLIRGGKASCLTQDHSVVGDLLRMKVIKNNQVRTHARRSILTRAIGMALFIQPDIFTVEIQPGDCLVLCSDGFWSVVEDEELASITQASDDPQAICRALVDTALERGSDDNISVIAARVRQLPGPPPNGKARRGWVARLFGLL